MTRVVCSHGFGVRADGRGLFTDIAQAFPELEFVLFDYNETADDGGIIASPLERQVELLEKVIDGNPDTFVLAHSQGCMTAALATLPRLKGVVLLAPPTGTSLPRVLEKMAARPGAVINLNGMSKYPRSDGTFTYLSKEYLESVRDKDPVELYGTLAGRQEVTIVRATEDNVLGATSFEDVPHARVVDVAGDHDFTGSARARLIEQLKTVFL